MKKLLFLSITIMLLLFNSSMAFTHSTNDVLAHTAKPGGKSDNDGDGVMNKFDDCPEVFGSIEAGGCPDADGDFVRDSEDDCPQTPGYAELNGCPDADVDGVRDSEDKCPQNWGLVEYKGCPDSDMDGIADDLDSCPLEAGDKRYNGCPDRDGDGVIDRVDVCPNEAGVAMNQGCPSLENDPNGDKDEDGVINSEDDCPHVSGPADNRGCPYTDEDNDGVLSNVDVCPKTFGPKENMGCPIIEKEVVDLIDVAFQNLEFETGKAVIKQSSYSSMKNLGKVIYENQDFKLLIEGHTDDVGSDYLNQILSEERAASVKALIVAQGVSPNRIQTKAYGESKPIESNETEAGRQANRRVELTIGFD